MNKLIALTILFVLLATGSLMASNTATKKIIKYRENTTFDFSGTTITSKAKTPDVFYVFRRKRTTGGKLQKAPKNFNYQHKNLISITKLILSE